MIKQLYVYAKPYRKHFIIGLFALFCVDLLNSAPPLILKNFIDSAELGIKTKDHGLFNKFFWLGASYIALSVLQGYFRYVWRMHLVTASHKAAERVRLEYHEKLQKLPKSFFDQNPIGDLMSLATNDVEAVRFAIGPALLVFADAIFLFITLPPFMILLSPKLTLISLIPISILPFLIPKIEKSIHNRYEKVQDHFSKLTGFAQENLEGIQVVKSFVKETSQVDRFDSLGREFVLLNLKLTKVQAIVEPLFLTTIAIGFFLLIRIGGREVIDNHIGLGTFIAFTKYLESLAWPMMALGMAITHYQRGKTSLGRISKVLSEKEETANIMGLPLEHQISYSIHRPLLEVKNLNFQYSDENQNPGFALKNISLVIEENTKNAIVGLIGSGKSTLIQLLTGILELPENTVFWKGVDFTHLRLFERRQLIAASTQEPFLFAETLEWNIGFGLSSTMDSDLRSNRIEDCLTQSAFGKANRKISLAYPLGQKGQNLSGGEKSRVSLARALAKNSPLILLDDTLSAVDTVTERQILNSISQVKNALLLTTHRLTGLSQFDQVILMDSGQISEIGNHQELLGNSSFYQHIHRLQK